MVAIKSVPAGLIAYAAPASIRDPSPTSMPYLQERRSQLGLRESPGDQPSWIEIPYRARAVLRRGRT